MKAVDMIELVIDTTFKGIVLFLLINFLHGSQIVPMQAVEIALLTARIERLEERAQGQSAATDYIMQEISKLKG